MSTITLQVNRENLVRNLKLSFSNSFTVLGELMQNARRAGAGRVLFEYDREARRLTVHDDGQGIADMQTLLTVAESDWDAGTIEREHPYGMGFLSALYAGDTIAVSSRGRRIEANTTDILAFRPVPVRDCPATADRPGAMIEIRGIGFRYPPAGRLKELARGFPIPVFIDGKELARPHALDRAASGWIAGEIGDFWISGISDDGKPDGDAAVYLQGLPVQVYGNTHWWRGGNIVHLDSRRFHARMPDRDKLIDEDTVVRRIREAIRSIWRTRLEAIKAERGAAYLADRCYEALKLFDCLDLLNDADFLHQQAIERIVGYPIVCEWSTITESCGKPLARRDVAEGKAVLCRIDDLAREDDFPNVLLAKALGMVLVAISELHPDHWARGHIVDLTADDITITPAGNVRTERFHGNWLYGVHVVFCDRYAIAWDGGDGATFRAEIAREALYDWASNTIFYPAGCASSAVVHQAASFLSEVEDYQEDARDLEYELFWRFVLSVRTQDPAAVLEHVLRDVKLDRYAVLDRATLLVCCGGGKTAKAVRVFEADALLQAARAVIDRWETGDLAGAVKALDAALEKLGQDA